MYRSKIELHNVDCLPFMKQCEDEQFDLAIVDPPYGIGISSNPVRQQHEKKSWDNAIPSKEYFDELKRVSKHQIVWGGNYFLQYLDNTQCFLIWDKKQPFDFSLAMCEMAWTSFSKPAKIFTQSVLKERNKIHPTQKPIELYKWLLTHYAEKGQKILDTHLGGGSIAIACDELGFDLTACEIDKDYFDKANKRLKPYRNQQALF